ncbi:helix-turn-helix transcriptional regulator [Kineococcus rhizosphaerae]|uniref:Regulatory LuxR family protein n=1 Tax=Kineococcus rhizosphaerae TaxID=559628 RepID=A0A2T0R3J7_9ACTN|nr:LuxR C-terminal-related transcriptional regulator [Kineococcus rhizosphaerae]PRY14648.1 regulatory LuxR family protein [Kineococcus rhizosphaerae]
MNLPLRGRDAELAAVARRLSSGRGVHVAGARGTGRSAMLAASVSAPGSPAGTVLHLVATGRDSATPLGIAQHLHGLLGGPVLRPDSALADLSAALRDVRPALVTVDDLDRADPGSRVLLTRLRAWFPVLTTATGTQDADVVLHPLTPEDAHRVLDDLGVARGAGRVPLLRRAAGNPLALVDLTGPEAGLGRRAREAFADGLDDLPAATRRALLELALADRTRRPAGRAAVWRCRAGDLGPALAAGLLVPAPTSARSPVPRFAHPLTAEIVLDDATTHQRRAAHRRLAADLPGTEPARDWHLALAGPDEAAAARLDALAGRLAARGAPRAAAHVLAAAAASGVGTAAPQRLLAAARQARAAGDLAWAGRLTAGTPYDDAVFRAVGEAWWDPSPLARRRAEELLDAATGPEGETVRAWGRGLLDPVGHHDRIRAEIAEHGPRLSAMGASEPTRWGALGGLALAVDETGRAVEFLTRSVAVAPQVVNAGGRTVDGLLTIALLDAGRWDDALARLAAASRAGDGTDVSALVSRAVLAVLRDEPDHHDHVLRALRAMPPATSALHDARLARARGLAAAGLGDHPAALRHLRRLRGPRGEALHPLVSDVALADAVAAHGAVGEREAARRLVETALRRGSLSSVRRELVLHRARALLDDEPEEHFRRALAPEAGRWPLEAAITRLEFAQWLRRRGRPADSRPLLRAAGETFARLGAPGWAARARSELAAAGAGDPSPTAGLSARQREVAVLAAQGWTTPQIAQRLGISARTVHSHLAGAFRVLGVSRRVQLSTALGEELHGR